MAGAGQALADFARCDLQALDQFVAASADLVDHALAGATEREGDLVALVAQRHGDAFARLGDRLGDRTAGGFEVLADVLMGAADGELDLLGIADDGFALRHQFVDQRAQPDLVVGIGALQRRDLAADNGLELAGPRHGAFDAVAHRRDLAADGLAQREHGIGGDDLGLGQAQRDLGHRARDQAHLLGAAIERRQNEEEHDRCAGAQREQGPLARAEGDDAGRQTLGEGAVAADQGEADAAEPGQGREGGEPVGLGGGAGGEGLDEGAGIAAVVIGDAAGVGGDGRARRCRGLGRFRLRRSGFDARQLDLEVAAGSSGQLQLGIAG